LKNKIRVGFIYGLLAMGFALTMLPIINFLVKSKLLSEPSDIKFDGMSLMEVFFLMVIMAPLTEEFIFRWLPISWLGSITGNKSVLWIIIITSSAIFGISHGSWHHIFM